MLYISVPIYVTEAWYCCLELYYCIMVEWFGWDSSLISMTNWFPSVLCMGATTGGPGGPDPQVFM